MSSGMLNSVVRWMLTDVSEFPDCHRHSGQPTTIRHPRRQPSPHKRSLNVCLMINKQITACCIKTWIQFNFFDTAFINRFDVDIWQPPLYSAGAELYRGTYTIKNKEILWISLSLITDCIHLAFTVFFAVMIWNVGDLKGTLYFFRLGSEEFSGLRAEKFYISFTSS
jgi:hypothetical protein